jgi:hypothetical protein
MMKKLRNDYIVSKTIITVRYLNTLGKWITEDLSFGSEVFRKFGNKIVTDSLVGNRKTTQPKTIKILKMRTEVNK